MNNRERFLRVMHYEPVDHPPFHIDKPLDETWQRWYAEGYPEGVNLGEFLGVEHWGYSFVPYFGQADIDTFLIPAYEPKVIEDHGDYCIDMDDFGARRKVYKDHASMPLWLEYSVKNGHDLLALIDRLQWNGGAGRIPADWDTRVRQANAEGETFGASGGSYYGTLRNLMGPEAVSLMLYDAPEAIKRYLDAYHELIMTVLERVLNDVTVSWIWFGEDFAYKTSSLISPAMYRELIMPKQQAVVGLATSRGVDIFFFDSDGNLNEMLPHLLEGGINLVSPLECAADMDPVKLRARFGKALRMQGGIDKRALARDKAAIRDEVMYKVPELIAEGGYIPGVDHAVPADISLENYVYYTDCIKECYGAK